MQKNGYTFATVYSKCVSVFLHQTILWKSEENLDLFLIFLAVHQAMNANLPVRQQEFQQKKLKTESIPFLTLISGNWKSLFTYFILWAVVLNFSDIERQRGSKVLLQQYFILQQSCRELVESLFCQLFQKTFDLPSKGHP